MPRWIVLETKETGAIVSIDYDTVTAYSPYPNSCVLHFGHLTKEEFKNTMTSVAYSTKDKKPPDSIRFLLGEELEIKPRKVKNRPKKSVLDGNIWSF